MTAKDITVPGAEPGTFLALQSDPDEIAALIRDSFDGLEIDEFTLPRATLPSGKGTRWEVPTAAGMDEPKTIEGIVVGRRSTRQWWPGKPEQTGGNVPPSCSSPDGKTGFGKQWATIGDLDPQTGPGEDGDGTPREVVCASCPHSQWGSAPGENGNGRGQACTSRLQVAILTPGRLLPLIVSAPPTSVKPLTRFLVNLAGEGIRPETAIVRLELTTEVSGGNPHPVIVPSFVDKVDPELVARAKAYSVAIGPIIGRVPVDRQEP